MREEAYSTHETQDKY